MYRIVIAEQLPDMTGAYSADEFDDKDAAAIHESTGGQALVGGGDGGAGRTARLCSRRRAMRSPP
ncbi:MULTISPECIES: hypothetical protein [Streptomyces]|uniref:hypothetical protein n=1 Tax=Streptomyces TaxID=1883 RepID=UPI0004CD234C|nr:MULTISPECIES: hypothetical protein [Streptomyces]KOT47118.1 hypothetical protein ADK43_40285 [Streptomyces rimosus subsp. rimosus]